MSTQGYRMSHTYVWNVEKSRAHELIHEMLSNILQEQPKEYLPLQELIASMNRRGRQYHIHTQKKHNSWSKYIKMTYGDMEDFLQDYRFYKVVKEGTKTRVYFVKDFYTEDEKHRRFTTDKEWIFVDESHT